MTPPVTSAAGNTASALPRTLVVVPTLNEEKNIGRIIDALLTGIGAQDHVHLVVADGGSTDATCAIVDSMARDRPWIGRIDNPARIQSAGVNRAAALFGEQADILIRCDAHADYPPNFVRQLAVTLNATGADSVVVPMDSVGHTCAGRAIAWVSDTRIGSGGAAHRGGRRSQYVDHGHHAAFRMACFRNVGGYDESFSHNEDAELDCRLRAAGGRIYLDADNRIVYHSRPTLRGLWTQYRNYGRGRARTVRRHPRSLRLRQLIVPVFISSNVLAIAMSGSTRWALVVPICYFALLAATSLQVAWRRRSCCGLLAGIAALFMHSAWSWGFIGEFFFGSAKRPPASGTDSGVDLDIGSQIRTETGTGTERPRVLLLDPSLFTGPYDAALSDGLAAHGIDHVWAVRPLRRGQQGDIPATRMQSMFYRHVDDAAWIPRRLRGPAKGVAHVVGWIRLYKYVRKHRLTVVHVQWAVIPLLDSAFLFLLRRRCSVIVTVHDAVPFNGQTISLLQNWGFDLPIRLAHRVIVHTEAASTTLHKRGHDAGKIRVIPHGPLHLAPSVREGPDVAGWVRDERLTFVLFGQLKPYKGIDCLVEAVGRLAPATRVKARFIVAGAPFMDMQPLLRRAEALEVAPLFDWTLRRLSEGEMAALFATADVFVFPYRYIDASGVYYMVRPYGKWIIASHVGVFAEDLVGGVDGITVPAEDVDALAAALSDAIVNPQAVRPAVSAAVGAATWTGIAARTIALYREACA